MNNVIISFAADRQKLRKTGGIDRYASNLVNYVSAEFDLSDEWENFDSVRAVWFTDFKKVATVLDSSGTCAVPNELFTKTGKISVNLVGSVVSGGELADRLTTYPALALTVNANARIGSQDKQLTPSQFEQFVEIVKAEVSKIKDIETVELGEDYTLTILFTDGTSVTTPSIRGEQGETGVTPNITVGTVTTLPAGANVTVSITGTAEAPVLNIGIPQGAKGEQGDVSRAQLDAAVTDLKSDIKIAPSANDKKIVDMGIGFKNLFVPYDAVNGVRLTAQGADYNTSGYWTSDYIPISPSKKYYFHLIDPQSLARFATYDANKTFISSHLKQDSPVTTESNASYVRICDIASNLNDAYIVEEYDPRLYSVIDLYGKVGGNAENTIFNDISLSPATVNNSGSLMRNGAINSRVTGYNTDFIPIADMSDFYLTAQCQYDTALFVLYDSNQVKVAHYNGAWGGGQSSSLVKVTRSFFKLSEMLELYPTAKYIRFGSYGTTLPVELFLSEPLQDDALWSYVAGMGNPLYGKKYVACGDSFTEGYYAGYIDEHGKSGKESDAYDKWMQVWKTYPWWIAKRNNMTLVNEAKSGSDFTNVSGAVNPFSATRYTQVPADADYITLMFGLNEYNIADDPATLGTKTDSDNTTLWGAYNVVLQYFLTNMPYAKIGIIIPDAWMTKSYADAIHEIGEYWGVPVLDMKFSANVPMGIDGRPNASTVARSLRDNAFTLSASNHHPNLKAQEYRSTFIEDFLRRL